MAIKVIKTTDNPETPEVLAAAIIKIADGFQQLLNNGLNEDAVVALIHHMRGVQGIASKPQIALVLSKLKELKGYYVRKPRGN